MSVFFFWWESKPHRKQNVKGRGRRAEVSCGSHKASESRTEKVQGGDD